MNTEPEVTTVEDALAEVAEALGIVAPRTIRSLIGDQSYFQSIIALAQSHAMIFSIVDDPENGASDRDEPSRVDSTVAAGLLDAVHSLLCAVNGSLIYHEDDTPVFDEEWPEEDVVDAARDSVAILCPGSKTIH